MIREIFFPAKIGKYRLFSERILGFSIQEQIVSCVQVYAKRSKTYVEKIIKEQIEIGIPDTYAERVVQIIKKILASVDKYDQVRVSIPASMVVFKEMEVPFKDADKIRMVLDYEIEPMLPFSVEEAVTDFIITRYSKEENKSQILAAAVRQQDLASILDIYRVAGVEPTNITIDLFAIYGLYQQIPEYRNIKNASVIIDLGANTTRIAFLQNGELRLTRIMPKGITNILQSISTQTKITPELAKENLERFGFQVTGNSLFDKEAQKQMISFFNDIQFTLNSFSLTLGSEQGISKILFTGPYSMLKNLTQFCKDVLQTPCEIFACEKIFIDGHYQNKVKEFTNNWTAYSFALGTALPSEQQCEFDLRRKMFSLPMHELINKQLISACLIILIVFSTLFLRGYLQISRLSTAIKTMEKRESGRLKRILPKDYKFPKEPQFAKLVKDAKRELDLKLEMWAPFEKERMQPLFILQELTNMIDKRRFDVSIEKVSMTEERGVFEAVEKGQTEVEVEGFFRSKTGTNHYTYFAELEKGLGESKILKLKETIDSRLEEDKGVKFTAKFVTTKSTT